jgi:hypothetical protein
MAKPVGYVSMRGVLCKLPKQWPWALRVVAKHGWVLSTPCFNPADLVAFEKAAPQIVDLSKAALTGDDLQQLVSLAFLKWPWAIDRWVQLSEGLVASTTGSSDLVASAYHRHSLELATSLDGADEAWFHEQVSTGRQPMLLGALAWLRATGAIAPESIQSKTAQSRRRGLPANSADLGPQPKRRRLPTKTSPDEAGKGRELEPLPWPNSPPEGEESEASRELTGLDAPPLPVPRIATISQAWTSNEPGRRFVLQDDVSNWQGIVDLALSTPPIQLPRAACDIKAFVDSISHFASLYPGVKYHLCCGLLA